MKNRFGFTLAEVLITLAIVGIVAALTIPNLIVKYQERAMVVTLKQTYSYISQAYTSALYENGSPINWELGGFLDGEGAANLTDKLEPYLKVERNCRNKVDEKCLDRIVYKKLSGESGGQLDGRDYSRMKLKNKAVLISQILDEKCISRFGELKNVCGAIMVDVNGNDGPNTWGKDLHRFYLSTERVIPSGSRLAPVNDWASFEMACASNNGDIHGAQCTAWVIENGNMDYLHCPEKLSWAGKHSCKE